MKAAVRMYGITISKLSLAQTAKLLQEHIDSGSRTPKQVITANPIMMMAALSDPAFMQVMRHAELVVPDGIGIVLASRIIGNRIDERVAGIDLMHQLLETGSAKGYRIYLLGAADDVVAETARRISARYPGIVIAGYRDGFFGEEDNEAVVAQIRESQPDVLFVARGLDTQEPWIGRYKQALSVPVVMGVGGSFDVISGRVKRAPVLFQKLGLEWFYRLMREPSRYKRMLVLPKFALKVLRDRKKVQL